MKVVLKAEADRLGLSLYYTGKPCKWGHDAERRTINSTCVICSRARIRKWHHSNPGGRRAYRQQRQLSGHAAEAGAWLRVKSEYPNSLVPGEDRDALRAIYRRAQELSQKEGQRYEVDHVVPLSAGGRHSANNLQVITASENRSKGGACRRCADLERELNTLRQLLRDTNDPSGDTA